MEFRVEPEVCPVDEPVSLRVIAVADHTLGPGTVLRYVLPPSWTASGYSQSFTKAVQTDDPAGEHYLAVTAPAARFDVAIERVTLAAGTLDRHRRIVVATLREGKVPAGGQVTLAFRHTRAPWVAERGEVAVSVNGAVPITVSGQEHRDWPWLVTRGAAAERVKVLVPSGVAPGVPFPVAVVSLDPYWNVSSSSFRDVVLRLEDGPILARGIAFTGSYTTQATIAGEGVFRLACAGAVSNPVRVREGSHGPYWGDLHAHDTMHNCGFGEDPYGYARHVARLDFMALADDKSRMSPPYWATHRARAVAADDPGQFAAFLAYEAGFPGGHHNVIFRDHDGDMFDVTDKSLYDIRRLLPTLDPDRTIAIPHHPGYRGGSMTLREYVDDPRVRLVEIYSHHGQSEQYDPEHVLAYEYNRSRGRERRYNSSVPDPVYAQDAWRQGRRLGVVGGSDDHMGQPGKDVRGLTAVYAHSGTREAVFDALRARRCYATTGERLLLDFTVNGAPMGSEVTAPAGSSLDLRVQVHGTEEVAAVDVLRWRHGDGAAWETVFHAEPRQRDCAYTLSETASGRDIYYIRVRQMWPVAGWPVFAWSSPVWIDAP